MTRIRTFVLCTLQFSAVLLTTFVLQMLVFQTPAARAQAPVRYLDYDVTLDVQPDGAVHVAMTQRIAFDGEFTTAFFEIPRSYVTDITDIEVSALPVDESGAVVSGGAPTATPFTVDARSDTIWVEWTYPQTQPGDVRAFLLEYKAAGAVWIYPDSDFITWDAVNADRSGVGVEASTVRVTLPAFIDMSTVTYNASGPEYRARVDGQSIIFTAQEPIDDATAFNVAVSFPHGLLDTTPQPWQQQIDAESVNVTLDNVDVAMTIAADGMLAVAERYDLTVTDGYLSTGFRELQLLYLDAVRDFTMSQDGVPLRAAAAPCAGCVVLTDTPRAPNWVEYRNWQGEVFVDESRTGAFTADWQHAQLGPGAATSFDMRYRVEGALRIDATGQFMTWEVLPDYGVPVAQAQVTLHLPPGVSADQVTVEGGAVDTLDAQTLRLRYTGDGATRPRWQIGITLPPDATTAVTPAWQRDLEQALLEQQQATEDAARQTVVRRTGGIIAIVLGIIGLILGWFRWGRQRVKEQTGGYLTAPPSDLDAGIVAYLVDDNAATQSLLASIFQLAAIGVLEVELEPELRLRRTHADALQAGAKMTSPSGETVRISKHIATLFNTVMRPAVPTDEFVPLRAVTPGLHQHAADLFAALAEDTQRYFVDAGAGRSRRSALPMVGFALWGVVIASVFLRAVSGARMDFNFLAPFLLVMFLFVMVLNFVGGTGRKRHTDAGAAEAARWRKFRAYLLDMEQYGDHGAAQAILDRYFAYAVALGVADDVLKQADALGAAPPVWLPTPPPRPFAFEPMTVDRPEPGSGMPSSGMPSLPRPESAGTPSGAGTSSGAPRPRPSLSGMSTALAASIGAASTTMGNTLSAAAGNTPTKITLRQGGAQRTLEWSSGTSMSTVVDDLMRDSFTQARQAQAARTTSSSSSSSSSSSGGSRSWSSGSSSRSSGGFGRSSGRSSSSRSSGGSRRSGGGGRSGFR